MPAIPVFYLAQVSWESGMLKPLKVIAISVFAAEILFANISVAQKSVFSPRPCSFSIVFPGDYNRYETYVDRQGQNLTKVQGAELTISGLYKAECGRVLPEAVNDLHEAKALQIMSRIADDYGLFSRTYEYDTYGSVKVYTIRGHMNSDRGPLGLIIKNYLTKFSNLTVYVGFFIDEGIKTDQMRFLNSVTHEPR